MSVKLSDVLEPFNGEGDIVEWLKKINLVVKLQKLGDSAAIIPLLLKGNAFAVYDQMLDGDKADAGKIEQALIGSFSLSRFSAYKEFTGRRFSGNEAVDVFVSDLRRLAKLAKMEDEEIVVNAFIVGFDSDISCQLRQFHQKRGVTFNDIIEQSRILVTERNEIVSCVAKKLDPAQCQNWRNDEKNEIRRSQPPICYRCGAKGHISRFCRQPDKNNGAGGGGKIVCFSCREEGHIASVCPRRDFATGVRCQLCSKPGHSAKSCLSENS